MRTHQEIDARSLAMHRLVAERIRRDPALIARAKVEEDGECVVPALSAGLARRFAVNYSIPGGTTALSTQNAAKHSVSRAYEQRRRGAARTCRVKTRKRPNPR